MAVSSSMRSCYIFFFLVFGFDSCTHLDNVDLGGSDSEHGEEE